MPGVRPPSARLLLFIAAAWFAQAFFEGAGTAAPAAATARVTAVPTVAKPTA